jgi:hypothetical protein
MKGRHSILFVFIIFIAGVWFGGGSPQWFSTEPAFAQASQAKTVRAESFELVDKKGRLRAKLIVGGKEEEPMLVAYDQNEKPTAAYGLNGEGPVQNLLDRILRP